MKSIVDMLDAIMGCACVDTATKVRASFLKSQIQGTEIFGSIFGDLFRSR